MEHYIWGAGRGWVLAELGLMHIGYSDARAGEAAQVAYLECQAVAIKGAFDMGRRRCVLNHAPSATQMSPKARKAFGDMLKAHHEQLAKTVMFYVLNTPSPIVRGLATAVMWLAPPPYPHAIVGTTDQAFERIAQADPRIDAEAYREAYRRILLEHVPDLQLSA